MKGKVKKIKSFYISSPTESMIDEDIKNAIEEVHLNLPGNKDIALTEEERKTMPEEIIKWHIDHAHL
ncbi:MAG TPA: hypothetical protein PLG90_11225 [Ignavibacteria bacterium]|nr:hypothetical protein [Ignavibacteria bacterium]